MLELNAIQDCAELSNFKVISGDSVEADGLTENRGAWFVFSVFFFVYVSAEFPSSVRTTAQSRKNNLS